MKNKQKVIFLLPALNEEKAIGQTIDKIPIKTIKNEGYDSEIVIVDGGSTDKTREIAKGKGAIVIISPKRGYGFQLRYALKNLGGEILITGDADGTYPFEIAPKLIKLLEKENLDFITTNRFAGLGNNSMSFSHFLGNKILTILGNILFNLRLKDNQSGMWCFNLNKVKELNLENNDMAFSEEIKIRAFKKLKCKEINIHYAPRIGTSKLNYMHAIKNTLFLFKLRLEI
jgi:glycosyltransferase involved in cell wall biosynthesis